MGRRRRRIVKVVKRKLPTVFSCPSCGEEAIKVVMSRSKSHALIQCAACGLKQETNISPADQMVDVYCRFTDKFYGANQAPTQERPAPAPERPPADQPAQPPRETEEKAEEEESKPSELKDEEDEADAGEESETDESPL